MKIVVVGAGLIGASVALAAERAWPDATLTTLDRGDSLGPAAGADVIILATPVDVILDIVTSEAHRFGDGLILDTGSTKRQIVTKARAAGLENFVGGHPVAGLASAGSQGARVDLFDGKPWFLIPAHDGSPAIERAREFVRALGATPVVQSDDGSEHDSVMAAVSHLPQVVASVLMHVVGQASGEQGLQWAGSGLRDTTRLAASPASMWESVLASNLDAIRPLLLEVAEQLRATADQLDDSQAVRRLFESANRHRTRLG